MRYRTMFLMSFLLALLAGCGDPAPQIGNSPASNNPTGITDNETEDLVTYKGTVYALGSLDGDLAGAIGGAMTLTPYNGTSADAPLFIPGNLIGRLSAQETAGVQATYQAKFPALLVQASADQVNQFRQLLGLGDSTFTLPADVGYVEIYGLDLEDNKTTVQWAQYPPSLRNGGLDPTDDQRDRVALLVEWLDQNGNRLNDLQAKSAPPAAASAAATANDLTQLAAAFVNQSNFTDDGNMYQITHFVYSCHSLTTGEDWFYVQQQCVFSGSGAYKGKMPWYGGGNSDAVFWYMDRMELDTSMGNYGTFPNLVGLQQSSPETANNTATVTSGVSFNIGGQLSINEAQGPGAAITGGVTISNSRSVSVRDCEVLNKSNDRGSNAHWIYQFKESETVAYYAYAAVTDPPTLSVTTFQPLNQWIWRMDPALRAQNVPMTVTFNARLNATIGVQDFLWVAHPRQQGYTKSWTYNVAIPYPPVP